MSDDNPKKSEELDFSDLGFDPFKDSGVVSAEKEEVPVADVQSETPSAADSGFDLPSFESSPIVSETPSAVEDVSASFLAGVGDEEQEPVAEILTDLPDVAVVTDVAVEEGKGKKGKKKKEKVVKPKKEKKVKAPKPEGAKEPVGVGGVFCLVSGFALLALLLIVDALMFVKPAWILGEAVVGSSSILYYVIALTVVGLAGVVAVPFMFFASRKETDVFRVALGISAMVISMGVIFLMTEHVRYDFTVKAPAVSALSMPTGAPVTPAAGP